MKTGAKERKRLKKLKKAISDEGWYTNTGGWFPGWSMRDLGY